MTLKLSDIFELPVDRPIEGVIKADDETGLRTELEEYVITNEIQRRLEQFLDAYNNYDNANGVWISGFFGSGKSHLLKMLAVLLENREVDGRLAVDIFLAKCGDNEILRGDLKRASSVPAKSILFNIDQKADVISKTQIDALLAVFQKVFDEMCGYYGKQGHIAQFERQLDGRGILGKFKEAYERFAGKPWERGREEALLEGPNIAKAYAEATGGDPASAQGILNSYRSEYKVSIEDFAQQVKAYIDRQPANFRLNFFVDEVGQYIADNIKLMTNLQTIAESLNTKCRGRAWIIVTAQQDMGAVIGDMTQRQENDFSKIQARFRVRMPLNSADVAEVIQRRLLKKTEAGVTALSDLYHEYQNDLRTLFDFADGSVRLRNFADRDHFIQSYPFVPYQYELFQMAIQELSQHNAFEGKHSSVGERSMLGVFQEVAICLAEIRLGGLATFDLMFEGIRSALKSNVQQSILLAERNLGDAFAVRVLKALFLVKYVRPFKATARNICVLMQGAFGEDQARLRSAVEEALDLLEQQTYIQRNGETYEFLTDEEKDVEQEIKAVEIDMTEIAREFEELVFEGVVRNRKIRHAGTGYEYPFSRRLDDRLSGREHELSINVITPFHDSAESPDAIRMLSISKDELVILLKPDSRFVADLMTYKRTEKYVRQSRSTSMRPTLERIITSKGQQNGANHNELARRIKGLIAEARLFVRGEEIEIRSEDPQSRIERAFQVLIDKVYVNLAMLRDVKYAESDIARYLKQSDDGLLGTGAASLTEAEQEILNFVQANRRSSIRTTLEAVLERFERKHYGWSYPAVLCTVASLCGRGKLEAKADSNVLEGDVLEKQLRNTASHKNVVLEPQVEFTPAQVRTLKEFVAEFSDAQPSGLDARLLAQDAATALTTTRNELQQYLEQQARYPFLSVLDPVLELVTAACDKPYGWYLTDFAPRMDGLLDAKESVLDPVRQFWNGAKREIYDDARQYLAAEQANFVHIGGQKSQAIQAMLDDPRCFDGNTMQQVKADLEMLRSAVRLELSNEIDPAVKEIEGLKDRLVALPEFAAQPADQRQAITAAFDRAVEDIRAAKLIALVRERARSFREEAYPGLLDRATRKPPEPAKETTGKAEARPTGDTISEDPAPEPRPEPVRFVPRNRVLVPFEKPYLADEADVERYLDATRDALLAEIRAGKRISL